MNIPASPKSKVGRPPKFRGPRQHVTVTLPETTLAKLAAIDADRALSTPGKDVKHVELVEVMPGLGIILVGPCEILQKIQGLRLVEAAPQCVFSL